MTERPIIFNGPMVRAILEGRKIQTRRPLKVQPDTRHREFEFENGVLKEFSRECGCWNVVNTIKCPFGKVGDTLWVRETWGIGTRPCPSQGWYDGIEYKADEVYCIDEHDSLACYPVQNLPEEVCLSDYSDKQGWKSSIHMPRWASRITLEITDVRVERLQSISEEDAIAEGCRPFFDKDDPEFHVYPSGDKIEMHPLKGPLDEFEKLWRSIYGSDSWESNQWVWAISFRRIEG